MKNVAKIEIVLHYPYSNALCPPTPLTENHFAKKPLAERGVPPPPKQKIAKKFPQKMGKNPLKRF